MLDYAAGPSRSAGVSSRLLVLVVVGALAIAATAVLSRAAHQIVLPLQLNFVEGFNAAASARLAATGSLYGDPAAQPWVATVYTPLYFLLTAAFTRIGCEALLASRMVAACSAFGIALVVCWVGWRRTGWIAAAAALGFLTAPVVQQWLPVARPDMTAVLLACLGVAVADRWMGQRTALWAAPLVAAAVLTKQSQIAALLAVTLAALLRDPRRGWRVGALAAGGVAVVVAWLQFAGEGHFWWHTVSANANPFSWHRALAIATRFAGSHAPELALLVALLVIGALRRPLSAAWLYAALSVPLAAAVGKAGSDSNYFIEPLAATALLAATAFPLAYLRRPHRVARSAAALLALGVVAVAAARGYRVLRAPLPNEPTVASYLAAAEYLRNVPGLVVSDDATLLRIADRPIIFQPFVMSQAAESGRWDERSFVAALEDGTITRVVAELEPREVFESRYTPAMRRIIESKFRGVATLRCGFVYTVLARRTSGTQTE